MSDGPRSCHLKQELPTKNLISVFFQNQKIEFPSITSIESTIENLFMSQISHYNYEAENFKSFIDGEQIIVQLNKNNLVFVDNVSLFEFEDFLCQLYSKYSD